MILECYNLLKKIESRLGMWIGEATLKNINIYISGYYMALLEHNIIDTPPTDDNFFDWVAKKLGYYESTAGWANMILAHCMGFNPKKINWEKFFAILPTKEQHLKSIRYFYLLVEEFKKELNDKLMT
jgi:hypothetical protein